MSTLECSSHRDFAAKTGADPHVRVINEKLGIRHDGSKGGNSIVGTDANNLRAINDTQAKNLPPEILSLIFEFACPPIDFESRFSDWIPGFDTFCAQDTFHFILATVCCEWRDVVKSTPQLWTTITLKPNKPNYSIQSAISLLNIYFDRAGALPISIELDFHGEEAQWHAYLDEPVKVDKEYFARLEPLKRAIFVDRALKIQHISLIQVPTNWLPFVNEHLSQCTSLAVFDPMVLIEGEDDEDQSKDEGSGNVGKRNNGNGGAIVGKISGGDDEQSDEGSDNDSNDEESSDDSDEDALLYSPEIQIYPFELNLTKVPLLRRIDLVFVPYLRSISVPHEDVQIRIRKFKIYNSLLSSLVSITMLSRIADDLFSPVGGVDR